MSSCTQQKFRFGDRVGGDWGTTPWASLRLSLVGGIARMLLGGIDAPASCFVDVIMFHIIGRHGVYSKACG